MLVDYRITRRGVIVKTYIEAAHNGSQFSYTMTYINPLFFILFGISSILNISQQVVITLSKCLRV
jgi:hypothetical protein